MKSPDIEHSEKFSWVQYASHLEKKIAELSREVLHNYQEEKRFIVWDAAHDEYKKGYLDGVKNTTKFTRMRIHHEFNVPYTEAYDDKTP